MNEEEVRTTLSVALPALNADIIKVVIPQLELFAGTGILAFKFHCRMVKRYRAFPLCSYKKALLSILVGVKKGMSFGNGVNP